MRQRRLPASWPGRKHRRRRELEDLVGARGEGIEIRLRDRPAVERADQRRLEVGVIELAAPPAPVVRAAAETAHPADEGVVVVEADHVAAVEILRIRARSRARPPPSAPRGTLPFASARAREIPAGPAPAMQTSKISSKAGRSVRFASVNMALITQQDCDHHTTATSYFFANFACSATTSCPSLRAAVERPLLRPIPGDQPSISSAIRTITRAWRAEAMSISRPL